MNKEYNELQDQEWEIPTSNEYVSDVVSPLSLLPSPEVSSSTSSSPLLTDTDDTSYKLSCPETPQPNISIKTVQEEEYNSVRHHDHIIASNESIACIKPQNVSISWSNNLKSIIHIPTEQKSNDELKKLTHQRKKSRRTTTSYDSQTSLYLKSVFFEVYSKQSKLTKNQRAEVQEKTGLPSRNITYWFSNHKRRFKDTLKVYRRTVEESHGMIQNYKDFIRWRRSHDLPDQITQEELM